MPTPTYKTSTPAKDKDRRKSGGKPTLISTLKVSPNSLRKIIAPSEFKEESPSRNLQLHRPRDAPAPPAAVNGDNAFESNPGTPAQVPMGPPTDGPKKKGVKRSAPGANGNEPKIRGKPGPKKKPRLEDGSIDPSSRAGGAYHKLGPKANQGAINAGLRALDRSGKPCRRWAKGGFRLKSFTGVLWEVPRWTAPPKSLPESVNPESTASGESSNKENKEGSQLKSEHSNSAADGEQHSVPPSVVTASSPVPMPVAAAS
ncbi:hypothetical protein PG994_006190 [Apiospora phragmitis]|uniref:DUF1711 domain-containing protein n=1 Tax=Apiospora phragmitis TaxID=2905665 RepID=A0ABR1VHW6_9PEZI